MIDPIKQAMKGDILFAANNRNIKRIPGHYLVYIENIQNDNQFFIGAMLTHSPMNGNIIMQPEHFLEYDKNGKKFKFQFENTRVVNKFLLKKMIWAPFVKHGELTKAGIKFIDDNLTGPAAHFSLNA